VVTGKGRFLYPHVWQQRPLLLNKLSTIDKVMQLWATQLGQDLGLCEVTEEALKQSTEQLSPCPGFCVELGLMLFCLFSRAGCALATSYNDTWWGL